MIRSSWRIAKSASKRPRRGHNICGSARQRRWLATSGDHSVVAMRTASSAPWPAAISAPKIVPVLQPTTRSGRRPCFISTCTMPSAAMLRTPPLPTAIARRGRLGTEGAAS